MRDKDRIFKITGMLVTLWMQDDKQDQRLGQLLGNYVLPEMRQTHAWFIEDDEIEARLSKVIGVEP